MQISARIECFRPGVIEGYAFDELGNGSVAVRLQIGEFSLITLRANLPRTHLAPAPHRLDVGFSFVLDRDVWELLPNGAPIRLFDESDAEISYGASCLCVTEGADDGGKALAQRLASGDTINKWGSFFPGGRIDEAELAQLVVAYHNLDRRHFALLGQHLFVNYGSLLGLVRDRTHVPWDDDFDAGYFSYAETNIDFFNDFERRVTLLREAQEDIRVIRTGQFHWRDPETGLSIDVFGAWRSAGDELNMIFALRAQAGTELLQPLQASVWPGSGIPVWLPAQPEAFLEQIYGANWRVPDRHFVWRESAMLSRNVRSLVTSVMGDRNRFAAFAEEMGFRCCFFHEKIEVLNHIIRDLSMRIGEQQQKLDALANKGDEGAAPKPKRKRQPSRKTAREEPA